MWSQAAAWAASVWAAGAASAMQVLVLDTLAALATVLIVAPWVAGLLVPTWAGATRFLGTVALGAFAFAVMRDMTLAQVGQLSAALSTQFGAAGAGGATTGSVALAGGGGGLSGLIAGLPSMSSLFRMLLP